MHPLLMWFIAYVLPGFGTFSLVYFLYYFRRPASQVPLMKEFLLVHGGLVLSICISQYFLSVEGVGFWSASPWWLLLLVATGGGITLLIGKFGAAYTLSSLIQELGILSVGALLLRFYVPIIAILLVSTVFAGLHLLVTAHWKERLALTFIWGVFSMMLFILFRNVYLNAALHAIGGAILIRMEIIHPNVRRAAAQEL